MINMGFLPFVYLLIVSIVVSVILFFVLNVKGKIPGGYTIVLILGYLGAWVGTPVFGKWEFLTLGEISIIPAILGAVATILLVNACAEYHKKHEE